MIVITEDFQKDMIRLKPPTYNVETPDTIEVIVAKDVKIEDGALTFYLDDKLVAALGPGQWKRVWKVD